MKPSVQHVLPMVGNVDMTMIRKNPSVFAVIGFVTYEVFELAPCYSFFFVSDFNCGIGYGEWWETIRMISPVLIAFP